MAQRRSALFPADLDLETVQAAPGAGRPQRAFHELAQRETSILEGCLKARAVATTLYLLPDDHRRLRRMAIDRNISFQTLMLNAIDLLLTHGGEDPVERWETRRRARWR
ncbi:ribbon-helix-helix domain-containing protein [Belnapia rosea]|uniref:ribbon-helix-helix domain-containing protein n=1 Tax=Belnapia rosea TaxID=938405 RepID=UPI000882E1EB|nr:ribbon-helix-helix domain-containing protein [Belnapia rosea]SDB20204.1 hypothetical protein SAMN02927895_00795 [Belnapia rosea]